MRISDIDLSSKTKNKFKEYKFNYKASIENEINQVMLKPELNNIFGQEGKNGYFITLISLLKWVC